MYESNDDVLLKQLATKYKLEGEKLGLTRNFLLLNDEQQEAIVRTATRRLFTISPSTEDASENKKSRP